MGSTARLADFLVAGAMRSGTTSLYRYLGAHPAVFMAPKELGYFTERYASGPEWYGGQFAGAQPDQ
nr:sulfotransferase [Acidimicrobiia bacterium]